MDSGSGHVSASRYSIAIPQRDARHPVPGTACVACGFRGAPMVEVCTGLNFTGQLHSAR